MNPRKVDVINTINAMKESITAAPQEFSLEPLARRLLRAAVRRGLRGLRHGRISVVDAEGSQSFGAQDEVCPLHATVYVHDFCVYRRLALRGSIGVGEAYMAGEWTSDNLTALIRIFALNRAVSDGLEKGLARLAMIFLRVVQRLHPNTRAGARAHVAVHYDLGNEFYRLFLDPTLMYSCGIFDSDASSAFQASTAKNERICRKLQLQPDDHLLEIGSGWGGFALHAASRYGCRVTTTTVSREQYELAWSRVKQAGLQDRVTVLMEDYRDLDGCFDKLVSIEMIEAVGHQFLGTFMGVCSRLLKPQGMMLLQAITIADQEYERYRRAVDFIQQYIFPGGCLPSVTAICQAVAGASDMRLFHLEDIGPHYATTLERWRQRFLANREQIREQGFPESFIRMWEFYFCYCEGGFSERVIGTVQMLFTKPLCRRAPLLAALE